MHRVYAQEYMYRNICTGIYVQEYMFRNICTGIYVQEYVHKNICTGIYAQEYICAGIYAQEYVHRNLCTADLQNLLRASALSRCHPQGACTLGKVVLVMCCVFPLHVMLGFLSWFLRYARYTQC